MAAALQILAACAARMHNVTLSRADGEGSQNGNKLGDWAVFAAQTDVQLISTRAEN